jgi:apolipoprotein N-acyltransferase
MARDKRDPHLRPLLFSAFLAALFGALAIAETDSWWVVGATVGAYILLVLAIVLDVSRAGDSGPDAPTG